MNIESNHDYFEAFQKANMCFNFSVTLGSFIILREVCVCARSCPPLRARKGYELDVADVEQLARLTSLVTLDILDLEPCKGPRLFSRLTCIRNLKFVPLHYAPHCPSIRSLEVRLSRDIGYLRQLTGLLELHLINSGFAFDLSVLQYLSRLTSLGLQSINLKMQVGLLPLSHLTLLRALWLDELHVPPQLSLLTTLREFYLLDGNSSIPRGEVESVRNLPFGLVTSLYADTLTWDGILCDIEFPSLHRLVIKYAVNRFMIT